MYLVELCIFFLVSFSVFLIQKRYCDCLIEHLCLHGTLIMTALIASMILLPSLLYLFAFTLIGTAAMLVALILFDGSYAEIAQTLLVVLLCVGVTILFKPAFISLYQSMLFNKPVRLTGAVLATAESVLLSFCVGSLILLGGKYDNSNK